MNGRTTVSSVGKRKKKALDIWKRMTGLQDLHPLRLLGKGGFGSALLVEHQQYGHRLVLNVVRKGRVSNDKLGPATEREILAKISHPFIVGFHGAMQDTDHIYYLLEFCHGGDLGSLLCKYGSLNWATSQFFVAEILLAIHFLHLRQVVLRDLKPENVLVDCRGHVRLTDFGLSKTGVYNWTQGATTLCGTVPYVAPEVYFWAQYGLGADMWALGMMLYEFLTGGEFADEKEVSNILTDMENTLVKMPKRQRDSATTLVKGLLQRNPYRCLGVNNLGDFKSMPFFQGIPMNASKINSMPAPFLPEQLHSEATNLHENNTTKCNIPSQNKSGTGRPCITIESGKKFEGFAKQLPESPVQNYLKTIEQKFGNDMTSKGGNGSVYNDDSECLTHSNSSLFSANSTASTFNLSRCETLEEDYDSWIGDSNEDLLGKLETGLHIGNSSFI